jgi:hypothetical protein
MLIREIFKVVEVSGLPLVELVAKAAISRAMTSGWSKLTKV